MVRSSQNTNTHTAHTFKAVVAAGPEQVKSSPLCTIDGQWTGTSKVSKSASKHLPEGSTFLDVPRTSVNWKPATIKPESEMGPMESRRVWKDVAAGIRSGNFDQASQAKSKLENDQRTQRKDEQAKNAPWQLQLFDKVASDAECQ